MKPKHLAAVSLLLLTAALSMGCSAIPTLRTMATSAALGGSGQLFRNVRLCPITNSGGVKVAAAAVLGEDDSLWHDVLIAIDPLLGCNDGPTEKLRLGPGALRLDKKDRPKVLVGDRVTVTAVNASEVSRAERRRSMFAGSDEPELRRGIRFNKIGQ